MIGYWTYLPFSDAGADAQGACQIRSPNAHTLAVTNHFSDTNCPADPKIDASKWDAIFGASNTVQPKALRSYCLIRYE